MTGRHAATGATADNVLFCGPVWMDIPYFRPACAVADEVWAQLGSMYDQLADGFDLIETKAMQSKQQTH